MYYAVPVFILNSSLQHQSIINPWLLLSFLWVLYIGYSIQKGIYSCWAHTKAKKKSCVGVTQPTLKIPPTLEVFIIFIIVQFS